VQVVSRRGVASELREVTHARERDPMDNEDHGGGWMKDGRREVETVQYLSLVTSRPHVDISRSASTSVPWERGTLQNGGSR
jgi:hypothetical protein